MFLRNIKYNKPGIGLLVQACVPLTGNIAWFSINAFEASFIKFSYDACLHPCSGSLYFIKQR